MKRLIIIGFVVAAVSVAVQAARNHVAAPKPTSATAARQASISPGTVETVESTSRPPPVREAQEAFARYAMDIELQDDISAYIEAADRLNPIERREEAGRLLQRMERAERERQLVGPQALLLRREIAKAQFRGDPADRVAALTKLTSDYAPQAPSMSHLDVRYRAYKEREKEIVKEALSRAYYPNGVSRDAYLKKRLDEALQDAYAAPSGAQE